MKGQKKKIRKMERTVLTRFEVTRLVGLRSLQLSEGSQPAVHIENDSLREDTMYVAAMELRNGKLDARIKRRDSLVDVTECRLPSCLDIFLDTRDGGKRSYVETSVSARSL